MITSGRVCELHGRQAPTRRRYDGLRATYKDTSERPRISWRQRPQTPYLHIPCSVSKRLAPVSSGERMIRRATQVK